VHVAKMGARLGASASTGGVMGFVLSVLEDLSCVVITLLVLAFWFFALLFAAVGAMVFGVSALAVVRRLRRGRR